MDLQLVFTGLTGVNASNFPANLASSRKEVTRTIYDELQTAASGVVTVPVQSGTANVSSLFASYSAKNTRNRIVGVIYQAVYNVSMNSYNHATFYDYDVHGNVKELLQVQVESGLVDLNQHIKHLVYDYDLVSGNVNKVTYQKGYSDQFIHRYSYDDDNRITHVETSRDGVYYEKDAKYFYYDHGPLARTELGDKKVTTQDYAYTIQGWIKSVNGEDTKPLTMMGADGVSGLNAQVGRDVYGYSLSYYDGDYNAANTSMLTYSGNTTEQGTLGASLYNGNIRAMYTELTHSNQSDLKTHRSVYSYDQLNRIKSMTGAYRTWSGGVTGGDVSGYASNYSFDDNGNLLSLQRFIDQSDNQAGVSQAIDDLTYTYYKYDPLNPLNPPTEYTPMPNLTSLQGSSNQLAYVDDALGADPMGVGHSVMGADIAGQLSGNYAYDEIGRLIKDVKEGISNIAWTVTNKVKTITKSGMTISFEYDAMGHRVAKKVDHTGGDYEYTFYVLDAQGNTMTTYSRKKGGNNDEKLYLADRSIYGSSRLGLEDVGDLEMTGLQTSQLLQQPVYDIARNQNKVGDKQYELANHLGNVLNVVADRKIAKDDGTYNNGTFVSATLDGIVDYYTADILTHSDYFPYGMQLPNRKGQQSDAYRYGYQGSEMDNEVKDGGNSYTTFFRQLDPRLGRWLSIDPKATSMPWQSPYCSMDNNPIKLNDIFGDISDKKHKNLLKEEKKLKKEGEKISKREKKWAEKYIAENQNTVLEIGKDDYGNDRYYVRETFNEPGIGDLPGSKIVNGQTEKDFKNLNDKQEKNLTSLYGFKYQVGDVIGIQISGGAEFYALGGASYSVNVTMVAGETVFGYTVGGGIGLGTGLGMDAQLIVCTSPGRYNAESIQNGTGFEFSIGIGPINYCRSGDFKDGETGFAWDGATNTGNGVGTGVEFGKDAWAAFYYLLFRSVNAVKFKADVKYEWTTSGTYIRF